MNVWLWRWSSLLVVALVATAVTMRPPYQNWPPLRSDGAGYHIWTYAILKGDLSFAWYHGNPAAASLHKPDPASPRYACKYPIGVALIRLPVMAFCADPARNGPPFSPAEQWACLALGAAALVATVALGLATCYRLGVPPAWAHVSVLLLTFGTGLFHYGTYDASFSHIYSALLTAGLVWLAVRAGTQGRRLSVAAVTALVALLLLVRTTNVVLVGFWWLAGMAWHNAARASPGFRSRVMCGTAFGVALGVAITLGVNYEMLGHLTLNTYTGEKFNWHDSNMGHVLGGVSSGLFRYYPVLAVVLIVSFLPCQTRLAALGLLGVFAAYTVIYGHWWSWHLGSGFGHRGFVEAVPLVVPVLGKTLSSIPRRTAIIITALGSVLMLHTLIQMGNYWVRVVSV